MNSIEDYDCDIRVADDFGIIGNCDKWTLRKTCPGVAVIMFGL